MIDLSWGDPQIVRQALTETLGRKFTLTATHLASIGYTPHLGNPQLIEQLKDLAERQSGHRPKHLVVTCGATGAINCALNVLTTKETQFVFVNNHYFPMYPAIVGLSDNLMISGNYLGINLDKKTHISLIDSPSNPDGLIFPFNSVDIWDAAYASGTYGIGNSSPSQYAIMCGSLSKTLGLSGLRIGWISTDYDALFDKISNWVTANYIGLPYSSMMTAEKVLEALDQDKFENKARKYLDYNREEIQKVLTLFGQGDVPVRGMFATLFLEKAERKALEKAEIKWLSGEFWGENDKWARFSLGANRETIKSAVKAILN